MLVRRDVMRASKVMQDRVLNNPKIEVLWNTELLSVHGDEKLMNSIVVKSEGAEKSIDCNGLFYAIGHTPNVDFLKGQLESDEDGYLITKAGTTETNIEGVFACGDVQDRVYRQAITAAGTGCMAALEAERWLEDQHA